jgi:uncharacterized OB-fold protein
MSDKASGAEARYFAALAQDRFLIPWCRKCDAGVFFPREFCPSCLDSPLEWIAPAGTGTVYATTTVRLKPDEPYDVSLIDLDEGVRLMSRVESIPPDQVRIGMRVQARVARDNGAPVLAFVPLPPESA